jgi:hypothetical protein
MSVKVKRKHYWSVALWVGVLLILNALLTIELFPLNFLLIEQPIGYIDFMQHYTHADSFVKMVKDNHTTWGYNPTYMAGYPDLVWFDLDNKFVEILTLLGNFVGLSVAVSMKIVVFIEFLIEPFFILMAFLNFGFGLKSSILAYLGTLLILNGPVGLFFNVSGMFSFVFAAIFSFYTFSIFYKWICRNDEQSIKQTVLLGGCTCLAPLLHSTSIIMIGIPVGMLFLLNARSFDRKRWKCLIGIVSASILINLYWIYPLFINFHYTVAGERAWTGDFEWKNYGIIWLGGIVLTMGGVFGLAYLYRGARILRQNFKNQLVWIVLSVILIFVLLGGPGWVIARSIQPNRFLLLVLLYLMVPMIAVLNTFSIETRWNKRVMGSILLLSLLVPGLVMIFIRFGNPGQSTILEIAHKIFSRQMGAGVLVDPENLELIQWLNENTSSDQGRIMIEHPQGEGQESPFSVFYTGLLPGIHHYVKGQFLGAPRFETPLIHNKYTRFSHQEMFGIPIESLSTDDLRKRLELYNVKWIVAVEGNISNYLDNQPQLFTKKKEIGLVRIYEVNEDYGYFLQGSGQVRVSLNHIELSNLVGKDIVIKYHWQDGFETQPKVVIKPYNFEEDPVGFIHLINPPAQVSINFHKN